MQGPNMWHRCVSIFWRENSLRSSSACEPFFVKVCKRGRLSADCSRFFKASAARGCGLARPSCSVGASCRKFCRAACSFCGGACLHSARAIIAGEGVHHRAEGQLPQDNREARMATMTRRPMLVYSIGMDVFVMLAPSKARRRKLLRPRNNNVLNYAIIWALRGLCFVWT